MKKSLFSEELVQRRADRAHPAGSRQRPEEPVPVVPGARDQRDGCPLGAFYTWKRKFNGLQSQDVRRLKELEQENSQLKRLLAERDLEIDAVRCLVRKNGWALPSGPRERGL